MTMRKGGWREEERKKWERLRAGQLIADGGSTLSANGAAAATGEKDGAGAGAVAEEDGNRRFLATAGSAGVEKAVATKNDRIDALVAQGTMIRADLLTAIQSDLPGNVSAITREDVWSFDGRRVLIPAGTKLIGDYRSGITRGQTRIFVVWTRLLRDDGVSVQLGSIGTDDLGRAGQAGFVDQHYVERFGASILLSVIGGASQFIATLGQQSQLNNQQNTTQSYTDPVTGLHDNHHVAAKPKSAQRATDRVAANFAVADQALRGSAAGFDQHSSDDLRRSRDAHRHLCEKGSRFLELLPRSGERGVAGDKA